MRELVWPLEPRPRGTCLLFSGRGSVWECEGKKRVWVRNSTAFPGSRIQGMSQPRSGLACLLPACLR